MCDNASETSCGEARSYPFFVDSAAHALSFYTHAKVAVTIVELDLDCPDAGEGYEALLASRTPVIVLTRGVSADMNRYARAAVGSAAFITEPCTPQELLWIVERVSEGERNVVWPETEAPPSLCLGVAEFSRPLVI